MALAIIFGGLIFLGRKVPPYIKAMSDQAIISNEVIRSNGQFIQEMAKSNENVAKALEFMAPMFQRNLSLLELHDIRAQSMMADILLIKEQTSDIHRRSTDPRDCPYFDKFGQPVLRTNSK